MTGHGQTLLARIEAHEVTGDAPKGPQRKFGYRRPITAEDAILKPGARCLMPTGIAMALPEGFEGQVRPRSGLAVKHGITVLNAPGTVDRDYRGEIKVPLINLGETDFIIHRGDRIAQMVIAPVVRIAWRQVVLLEETTRGDGGFGSSGRR